MSETHRAEVRKLLCWALGEGHRVGRADIAADLDGWRRLAGLTPAAPAEPAPTAAPQPAPAVEQAPATPTLVLVHPDRTLTVAQAAGRLGVGQATVRRYLAPSSGRLTRRGDGVSAASVTAYAASRDAAIIRTRWTATPTALAA